MAGAAIPTWRGLQFPSYLRPAREGYHCACSSQQPKVGWVHLPKKHILADSGTQPGRSASTTTAARQSQGLDLVGEGSCAKLFKARGLLRLVKFHEHDPKRGSSPLVNLINVQIHINMGRWVLLLVKFGCQGHPPFGLESRRWLCFGSSGVGLTAQTLQN